MSRPHQIALDPDTSLCEGCGYALIGLPTDSRCPECGKPIPESIGPDIRRPPSWERTPRPSLREFLQTSASVLLHPARFYRTLLTRSPNPSARRFARIHWAMAAGLLGSAACFHATGYAGLLPQAVATFWIMLAGAILGVYLLIAATTHLAARLSAWEAAYRGLRLPLPVVLRGLRYHAPHLLPPALAIWATVIVFPPIHRELLYDYALWLKVLNFYHYLLAAEVVAAAFYLFKTYWTAMRNMMYANS